MEVSSRFTRLYWQLVFQDALQVEPRSKRVSPEVCTDTSNETNLDLDTTNSRWKKTICQKWWRLPIISTALKWLTSANNSWWKENYVCIACASSLYWVFLITLGEWEIKTRDLHDCRLVVSDHCFDVDCFVHDGQALVDQTLQLKEVGSGKDRGHAGRLNRDLVLSGGRLGH